jgi:hypothetical protein
VVVVVLVLVLAAVMIRNWNYKAGAENNGTVGLDLSSRKWRAVKK